MLQNRRKAKLALGEEKVIADLQKLKNPAKAKILAGFFKTSPGQYGEGDQFLGVVVPLQRVVAKKHTNLTLSELQKLLNSKIHECRLTALFILIDKYNKTPAERKKIIAFYLKNTNNINNWDLVDLSAPKILGDYLAKGEGGVKILYELAASKKLWEKRIAILSTYAFIRQNIFKHTLKTSKILLVDKHDLIHKAVGWMLREIGKRDLKTEKDFLQKYYKKMPRTMLRYAIEKFAPAERARFMK